LAIMTCFSIAVDGQNQILPDTIARPIRLTSRNSSTPTVGTMVKIRSTRKKSHGRYNKMNGLGKTSALLAGERLRPLGHISADGYRQASAGNTRRNCHCGEFYRTTFETIEKAQKRVFLRSLRARFGQIDQEIFVAGIFPQPYQATFKQPAYVLSKPVRSLASSITDQYFSHEFLSPPDI